MKTIAERLRTAREWKGWKQAQLAVAADVSTGTIGNIEAGIRQSKGSIPQIADALGVDYKWLANGEGSMVNDSKQNHPLALIDNAQAATSNVATLAQITQALSTYFEAMDASTRKIAVSLIGQLADDPQDHARIAAMIELSIHSKRPKAA